MIINNKKYIQENIYHSGVNQIYAKIFDFENKKL